MVCEDPKEILAVALLDEEIDGDLALGPILIRRATNQCGGRVSASNQLGRLQHSRAVELASQHDDEVSVLGRLGADQVASNG